VGGRSAAKACGVDGPVRDDRGGAAGENHEIGCPRFSNDAPCAFMDTFHPATVYNSIDVRGRYAYGNQPRIAHWNLAR
jgi:hypothetical protein